MAETSKEADALWNLQCAYKEKQAAKKAQADADAAFLAANTRYRAALRQVQELGLHANMTGG